MATETATLNVFNDEGEVIAIEGEQIKPNPMVWPVCDTCGFPYVLRRSISLTRGYLWAWQRDCAKPRSTCKDAGVAMYDAKGECPNTGREAVPS